MTNLDVMKRFLTKENAKTNIRNITSNHYTYKGYTLQTKNDNIGFCLYNYSTIIAFILDNKLYLNTHKYSPTTSKIQTQLKHQALYTEYKIIEYDEIV